MGRIQDFMINYKEELLAQYNLFPFHRHPMWRAVLDKDLSYQQIILAEVQHYLRSKRGRMLRQKALELAADAPAIYEKLLETYFEECTDDKTGPSHLSLIERLVMEGGQTPQTLKVAEMTPGNIASIALYEDITARGSGCHMLGAGVVEYYYSELSPKIFDVYTKHYGMSESQAETYKIHGPLDKEHGERALSILDEAIKLHGWGKIKASVRDAFVATSLHYDGMLQAATGKFSYWNGKD